MRLYGMSPDAINTTVFPSAPDAIPLATTPATTTPATTTPDATLPDDLDTLKRMIRELLDLLRSRDRELSGVQHRLDQLLRRLYGPKGEKFRADQPGLFDLLMEAEPAPPPPPASPPTEPECVAQPRKKGHGRRPLPADLRRERVVHDVPEADKVCSCCRTPRIKIGEEISEQLDYQPAKLFVWQHVLLKYSCPHCAQAAQTPLRTPLPSDPAVTEAAGPMPAPTMDHPSTAATTTLQAPSLSPVVVAASACTPAAIGSTVVIIAPKPAQPIDKGLPGPGLLAFVIVSKYCDHLPLNRQEGILGRHGVDLSRSTLCGWMAAAADLLRPLYEAMLADVLLSRVIQIDETRLPVLEKGNDKTKSGRLWTIVGDRHHPHTLYFYTPTKARDGPAQILKDYKAFMQADAANVYDAFYLPGGIREVGCWAHARRYFYDAQTSDAARAAEALARIGYFFDVERKATETIDKEKLENEQADALRVQMRQELTLPKMKEFKQWLAEQAKWVLPKSPMAQAINYANNHWEALLCFTEHGFLKIDNNAAERALRAGAVGRKNWMFAGSDEGGRTAAVLYTFTQTCRQHGIDPFVYLQDVLTRLPQGEYQNWSDLFPDRWAKSQRAAVENPG